MVYLKATFLTAAFALFASTLASPTPLEPRQNTTAPSTVFVTYIAGMCGFAGGGGYEIPGNSTITSGDCFKFLGYAYGVWELPDVDCVFTTYNDNACAPSKIDQAYPLPKGDSPVCIYGGAYDGGTHTERSGNYVCG